MVIITGWSYGNDQIMPKVFCFCLCCDPVFKSHVYVLGNKKYFEDLVR